ncbi:MAG: TonB-dependent receptor [Deltaproteobacteria bacterium]|nr:MAG: TonB-dependent receptor [Deltaproteobacteria bacterium]
MSSSTMTRSCDSSCRLRSARISRSIFARSSVAVSALSMPEYAWRQTRSLPRRGPPTVERSFNPARSYPPTTPHLRILAPTSRKPALLILCVCTIAMMFQRNIDLANAHANVPFVASTIVKAPHEVPPMKLRNSFNYRTFTGLTALLVTAGSTASGEPTLRMRPGPRRTAQATPPPQTAPVPTAAGAAPSAAPPPSPAAPPLPAAATTQQPAAPQPPAAPAQPPPSPDVAPDASAASPDAAPAATLEAPAKPAPTPGPEEAAVATDEVPPAGAEVIVVTGSRISDPLGKQAPVLLMSREDIERTGLTSVGDVLQQLTVSGGAINGKYNSSGNFGYPPDGGGIGAGAVEADLRFLGSKRVLVLVDGVRWVNGSSASGVPAATDLNTIPLGIIERIEVLEDGASPLYGSDAIAGVINIITRKEVSGLTASAYTGTFGQGDGVVQKYDVSWGGTTGKLSTVVGGSFVDQRAVSSGDRKISSFPVPNVGRCTSNCSGTGAHGRVTYYDRDGTKHDLALEDGSPGTFHTFTNDDRFNYQPYNYAETPSQRVNIFSALTYKLSPEINLRGKASFNNRSSVNQAAPEPLTIGPGAHTNSRLDRIAVDATNPYNPFGFTFDPMVDTGFVIARRPVEAGPRIFEQNVHTFSTSGGVDGHFDVGGQRFTWDATIAYGLNRAEQRRNNAFDSAKLQQALGPAYLGSDGRYHCGTMANPGDPTCVPFDLFDGQGADGRGTLTREMIAYTTFTEHDVSEQAIIDSVANLQGNLVQLPAGWAAAAVGVEHRRLSGFYEPDAIIAAGDGAGALALPTSGHYTVNEAYGELRAPLLAGTTGAQLLDVNVAGRVSDYSFLPPNFTGKVSARWKPVTDLVLRAGVGSGFRAPGIGELFGSKARFNPILADPCSGFNKSGVSAEVRQRCIDLGVPSNGSYVQANQQIGVTTGGSTSASRTARCGCRTGRGSTASMSSSHTTTSGSSPRSRRSTRSCSSINA